MRPREKFRKSFHEFSSRTGEEGQVRGITREACESVKTRGYKSRTIVGKSFGGSGATFVIRLIAAS
jgi:hypothetical protein